MKKLNPRKQTIFLLAILLLGGTAVTAFAQKDATRRLYVAVNGYELNEAAAKDALGAGADINWKNDAMGGETMLIMAIKGFQEAKVIKFLLDNGADPNVKDDSGKTALDWAHQYNIGKNQTGRDILKMLEAAAGQTKTTNKDQTTTGTNTAETNNPAPQKNTLAAKPTAPKTLTQRRAGGGAPTEDEVKEMIEKKMTSIYEDHFCCKEKNVVEFEWLAPIKVAGSQETRGRIPTPCWAVKLDVKITFTKKSSGETSWARRGVEGNPVKEIFCLFKDGFGDWDYLTYAP